MSSGSIARRYARAVFGLAEAEGNLDRTGQEVTALADAMKSSAELAQMLTNPAVGKSDRTKVITAIFEKIGVSKTVKHFSLLLLDRDRFSELPGIARELQALIDAKIGRVHAVVTSATALSAEQQQSLRVTLESLSGRKVEMETHEDPELLGGVVAKVGDLIYDGSLRTQLSQVKTRLSK